MHNRLERVRQRQEYRRASDANATPAGGTVELFNDHAVIDRENRLFPFGNLVRLVCAGQHGQLEYKRPVSYQDPKRVAITSYFNMYSGVEGQRGAFKSTSDLREVCFTDIITADGTLKISEEELAEVERTTFYLIQEPSNQNVQKVVNKVCERLRDYGNGSMSCQVTYRRSAEAAKMRTVVQFGVEFR